MPGTHQSHSITPLFREEDGETKYYKRLMRKDKDKESSLTSYHKDQNGLISEELV